MAIKVKVLDRPVEQVSYVRATLTGLAHTIAESPQTTMSCGSCAFVFTTTLSLMSGVGGGGYKIKWIVSSLE